MANRDGLEPGQLVDFETHQRVQRERTQRANESRREAPKPRSRKVDDEE